jgi:hypothetical protein
MRKDLLMVSHITDLTSHIKPIVPRKINRPKVDWQKGAGK